MTKTTRSARVLKISSRRAPSRDSSVASLLIAKLCCASIVMTTVRWSDIFGFEFGGGGCGTRASSPLGVSGVITMKIMISTSSTSIMGVMLMSDLTLPDPPTAIDI